MVRKLNRAGAILTPGASFEKFKKRTYKFWCIPNIKALGHLVPGKIF